MKFSVAEFDKLFGCEKGVLVRIVPLLGCVEAAANRLLENVRYEGPQKGKSGQTKGTQNGVIGNTFW